VIIVFSCEKEDPTILCGECINEDPFQINLYISFDPYKDGMHMPPVVNVYQGNIEDSVLVRTIFPEISPVNVLLSVNIKYTITATYYYIGKNIIAFDSTTPKAKYKGTVCDKPCYLPYNNEVDVRLRYLP
jgi:hypothetical protein